MSGNFKLVLTLSPCARRLHFRSPNNKVITFTDKKRNNNPASVATVAPCGVQKKVAEAPHDTLKVGGAKRVLFTLEQKEVMIKFYNRQAQCGIRTDADDCIAEMKARGLNPL